MRADQTLSYADLTSINGDGCRHELYDGSLLCIPPAGAAHDVVAGRVVEALTRHARTRHGRVLAAPVDVVFTPRDVLQPDIVFFHASRASLVHDGSPVRHVPDLVVEVMASNTAAVDRGPKMRVCAFRGVLEYWLVDPERESVEVYVLRDGDYELFQQAEGNDLVRSTILPSLELGVASVFDSTQLPPTGAGSGLPALSG